MRIGNRAAKYLLISFGLAVLVGQTYVFSSFFDPVEYRINNTKVKKNKKYI